MRVQIDKKKFKYHIYGHQLEEPPGKTVSLNTLNTSEHMTSLSCKISNIYPTSHLPTPPHPQPLSIQSPHILPKPPFISCISFQPSTSPNFPFPRFFFHSRHLSGYQKAAEPRPPRCGWDVKVQSARDPAEVVLAVREAAQGCGCQVHQAGPFLLSCTHGAAGSRVAFEAEVGHLPTEVSGVRFKRLWGAPLAFRDIATKVSKELEL